MPAELKSAADTKKIELQGSRGAYSLTRPAFNQRRVATLSFLTLVRAECTVQGVTVVCISTGATVEVF